MSRTYKDQPDWVKARRTGHIEARHGYRCENNEYKRSYETYRKYTVTTEPHWHLVDVYETMYLRTIGRTYRYKTGKKWVYTSTEEEHREYYTVYNDHPCDLDTGKNPDHHYCGYYYDPPEGTQWWHNETDKSACRAYYSSERHEARSTLKKAKDEYNFHGETDEEPYSRRNASGLYGGGYYW